MALNIVLTGGPSSGKTTMTKEIKDVYSTQALICQEAAEMLFRGGFPRQDSSEGLQQRQYAIFHLQKTLENIAEQTCQAADLIIYDRGLLDGLCYWPNNAPAFEEVMNIKINELRQKYDLIIQLGVAGADDYQNTAFRTEDPITSLEMEQKLQSIWSPHPNYEFIPYNASWETKRTRTLELIQQLKNN